MGCEAVGGHTHHSLTGLELTDGLTHPRDHAGTLDPQRNDFVLDTGIQAERLEHVAKIQSGALDFNLHFFRFERISTDRHVMQAVETGG